MSPALETQLRTDVRAGDVGEIVSLHGVLYSAEYGLDRSFEADAAAGLAGMVRRGWPREDEGVWIAERDGAIVGAIVLSREDPQLGRVRWFIVHPDARGEGLGRRLLAELLAFARAEGYRRLELETFQGLDAAAHLYVDAGFEVAKSRREARWGRTLLIQRYELELG